MLSSHLDCIYLTKKKVEFVHEQRKPVTIFPSCLHSYFLSSYFHRKNHYELWGARIIFFVSSIDVIQLLNLPFSSDAYFSFLKKRNYYFPLSFQLLFTKALKNSTVHV